MLRGGENLRHKKGVGAGCGFPGLVPLSIIVIFCKSQKTGKPTKAEKAESPKTLKSKKRGKVEKA
jgi:hypothetical protein